MKQKIKVEVAPAKDQWPKVFPDTIDAFRKGAKWVVAVAECASQMALYDEKHDEDHAAKQKPHFLEGQNIAVGFKDFDSMVAWWSNPYPVKSEPETIKVKDLKSGSFFQVGKDVFLHATCQHCPTLTNIGTTVVFDDNREVIPFYGTITINVGRDAE